jgi:hypothetical protein
LVCPKIGEDWLTDAEKPSSTPPTQEIELSYEQREAEIERADGEVLLIVDADVEKSGAHYNQYKLASDGKVITTPTPWLALFPNTVADIADDFGPPAI